MPKEGGDIRQVAGESMSIPCCLLVRSRRAVQARRRGRVRWREFSSPDLFA